MANPVTSGLVLQLDPSTQALSDGASDSSFADSSGNGGPTLTTAGGYSAPTYKKNIIGGSWPVVRFSGSNGLSASLSISSGPVSIYALLTNLSGPTSANRLVEFATSGTEEWGILTYRGGINVYNFQSQAFPFPDATNSPILISYRGDSTDQRYGANGTFSAISIASGAVPSSSTILLGQYAGGSGSGGVFDLGFLCVYTSKLTDAQDASVQNYILTTAGVISGGGSGGISRARVMGGM